MLAEILNTNPIDHLGFNMTLKQLSITLDKLTFIVVVAPQQQLLSPALSLLISSGSGSWSFSPNSQEDHDVIEGEILTKELDIDVSFTLHFSNIQYSWMQMRLDMTHLDDATRWSIYFSGYKRLMPALNLGGLAKQILDTAEIIYSGNPPAQFSAFCEHVTRPDFVVRMARLGRHGRFPGITAQDDGVLLASRLVVDWNILMIQEALSN